MDEHDVGRATPGGSSDDWQARVADTIEGAVGSVHDRLVRPLTVAARGLVFGVIIAVMAAVLGILAFIAVIRLLTVYAFAGRVWASDALVGALLVGAGTFFWSRRAARRAEET